MLVGQSSSRIRSWTEEPLIERAVFDYYLDTLTSRKEELDLSTSADGWQRRSCARTFFRRLVLSGAETARSMQKHTLLTLLSLNAEVRRRTESRI